MKVRRISTQTSFSYFFYLWNGGENGLHLLEIALACPLLTAVYRKASRFSCVQGLP
jgi:hypothetical protein